MTFLYKRILKFTLHFQAQYISVISSDIPNFRPISSSLQALKGMGKGAHIYIFSYYTLHSVSPEEYFP